MLSHSVQDGCPWKTDVEAAAFLEGSGEREDIREGPVIEGSVSEEQIWDVQRPFATAGRPIMPGQGHKDQEHYHTVC